MGIFSLIGLVNPSCPSIRGVENKTLLNIVINTKYNCWHIFYDEEVNNSLWGKKIRSMSHFIVCLRIGTWNTVIPSWVIHFDNLAWDMCCIPWTKPFPCHIYGTAEDVDVWINLSVIQCCRMTWMLVKLGNLSLQNILAALHLVMAKVDELLLQKIKVWW